MIGRPDQPVTGNEQLYSRWVWPERTASTLSLSPLSSWANAEPLPSMLAQSVEAAPSWVSRTTILAPSAFSSSA